MRKILIAGLLVISIIISVGLVNAVQNGYGPGDGDGVCDGDGPGPGEGNKKSYGYGDGSGICTGICDGDSEQFQHQKSKGNCYKNRVGSENSLE